MSTPIDLNKLPPIEYVQLMTHDECTQAALEYLREEYGDAPKGPQDPSYRNVRALAYREMLLRQEMQYCCEQTTLAKALGDALDHVGVTYHRTPRLEGESDEVYRSRIALAPEGVSVAGPAGAYRYHALSAHKNIHDVKVDAPRFSLAVLSDDLMQQLPVNAIVLIPEYDAGLENPKPGDVVLTLLAKDTAISAQEIDAVINRVNEEEIRPLTDYPYVRAATLREYEIEAEMYFYDNVIVSVVMELARENLNQYLQKINRIGHDVSQSGIEAALHIEGVHHVNVIDPVFNNNIISINDHEASRCININLINAGVAA